MRRVSFEGLERLSDFEVDVRLIHSKSSNISLVNLNEGESFEIEKSDFEVHVVVLSGEVEMISGSIQDIFKTGCLASILPHQNVYINSLKISRVLVIRDNPVWVMRARRSVRKFSSVPVSKDLILKVIDNARLAPSGGNIQPWKVYLTSDSEKKKLLSEFSFNQQHVSQAPWVLVITAIPEESEKEYGLRGRELYSIQDTANLALYIMLSAKAFGLDSCWVGEFDEEKVRKVISAPENERPVVIIPMGYGEESPAAPERKPLNEILVEF